MGRSLARTASPGYTRPMTALLAHAARTPDVYPHSYDLPNDAVLFVRLSQAQYEAASFLDQRILGPGVPGEWVPWSAAAAALDGAPLAEACDYVFHIGHVGSTLLARLLGGHPSVLSLREPAILRTLAQTHGALQEPESLWSPEGWEARTSLFLKLWSRTYAPGQRTVLKATSFVSEIAEALLARPSRPRAIAMTAAPEIYLATILAGPNSRVEARGAAQGRLRRLHRRLGAAPWRLWDLSEGETIAMGWACETAALHAAWRSAPERVLPLDFDAFLAEPQVRLAASFAHLGRPAAEAEVRALVESPIMRRYSKAPEHAYDAALRRRVLDEGRRLHGAELRKGLAWLKRAAADHPPIGDALAWATASSEGSQPTARPS